jgi:hypothetical protein
MVVCGCLVLLQVLLPSTPKLWVIIITCHYWISNAKQYINVQSSGYSEHINAICKKLKGTADPTVLQR